VFSYVPLADLAERVERFRLKSEGHGRSRLVRTELRRSMSSSPTAPSFDLVAVEKDRMS
jgi:hypothetical protein